MKSKSKMTKVSVGSLVPSGFVGYIRNLAVLVSLAALLPVVVAFAQAVSFSPATNFLIGGLHPASVAIRDLNGDGKPDLVTANIFSDSVSILLGTGSGAFGPATDFAVGAHPTSVAVADLNGDGKLDLAVANPHGGNVSILLGIGTGGFGAANNFPAGIRPISVAIGDLNGDGKPDLATANSGFVDDVSILLGDGIGMFGAATNFVAGASPSFVAIGDLNGDGKPDLAVTNAFHTSNNVSILLGTGTGSFGAATNFAVGMGPQSVAIADLNGDSKPDLAVANNGSNDVSILLGTGTGSFDAATNFPAGLIPASLAIGDLNGDAKPDLAVVTRNDAVSILLGTGNGDFGVATDFSVGTHPYFVAIGDLNGDGKPDLAVTNRAANTVSILLNITAFPPPVAACATPPPNMVAWWPMDETSGTTVADIVGGHNGTAQPAPIGAFSGPGPVSSSLWPPTFPPGMVGTSLFFDGNRRVEVPHDSALEPGTGDFTIDAWVFYAASGNGQLLTIAQKHTGATAPFGNTFDGWRFVIRDFSSTQGGLSFRGPFGLGGSVEEPITPNTWHHVGATLSTNASGFRIVKNYVDGVSSGQVGLNGNITSTANFLIGGDSIAAGPIAVDEVEIFNRALTQSEIQSLFNAGSSGKCKCVPPPSGMASWWPGEGNANDIISGNHGTVETGVTFAQGEVGSAFRFNGLDGGGGVNLGNVPAFDFTQSSSFTIDAWINSFGATLPANDGQFVVALNYDRSNTAQVLAIQSLSEKMFFQVRDANGVTAGPLFSPTALSKNAWHHVAGVRDVTNSGTTLKLYVDGVLVATASDPSTGPLLLNAPDLIGRRNINATTSTFNGLIDEVEVFNRALTQQEIQAIFNAGSAGKCKTVVNPNQPPVANAGPDQMVEATGPSGASVVLDGSGSSDSNNDPLTYTWSGPFDTVSGVNPTVALALGTHIVTLTVSDGQATATDTVNIIVQDTTPPDTIVNSAVDGNGAAVAGGGSTFSKSITFTFGGTDAVGVSGFQCKLDGAAAYTPCPVSYSGLALGNHTLQVRALDAAGNSDPSPASFTWTVVTCAQGGLFVVNSTADVVDANPGDGCCATADGVCTLRAAIQETNALPGPDTIGFDPVVFNSQKTILVDVNLGPLPAVIDGLTITGPGVDVLTVNANQTGSVFRITMGVVAISGLTITGGNAGAAGGGGIHNSGTLTLTNVTVSANSADSGAGIYNDVGGTLTVNSSTVRGNAVTLNTGGGGGIYSIGVGTVTINSSTISGNTAVGVSFGAGGGILIYNGTLILNNSTVSGNVAKYGGGIITSNNGIVLKLSNSTISGNTSNNGGGGIRTGEYTTTTLKNTIVAGNLNGGDCEISPTGNVVNSLGHNLDSDNSCRLIDSTDQHQPPLLGPLANNGGPTQTHALLTGSPAINKGDDCLAVDQRGVPRPQPAGGKCDIGAYELGNACAQPPSGLIGWWPGDNHSNDIWVGNDGVLIGGVSYATGQVKQSFSFPSLSSTGFDQVGINPGPSANTFTIEAWVFANQHGPSGYRTIYANDTRGFWLKSGRLNWWSPSFGDRFVGNTVVPLGAWHHIALTYSGGTFTGYLNGVNVGTSFSPGEFLPTGNGLGIGGHNYLPEDFDGLIDELAIYNRALDVSEIQAISNAGSAGKCKPIANPNHAPVANAGPDQTVEATSPLGASVTFNGSGSSDPDGDPLTFDWTGPFGTVSGVSPTVTLDLGTHSVTLTVNDGQASATDTVNIKVQDTTAPNTIINSALDGNGAAVASGGSTLSNSVTFTFAGTDAVGLSGFQCGLDGAEYAPCFNPTTHSGLAPGSHIFQVRALDAVGNIDPSPASFNWTVVNPVQGATFLVNSIADDMDAVPGDGTCLTTGGVCTLRAAIQETNAISGADTIGFDPNIFGVPRTITLGQRLPTVFQHLIITGPSAPLTVNANGAARVFRISGLSTATISDLTLTGGIDFNGGAIRNEGTLTLTRVAVRGNGTVGNGFGGGIYNRGPLLILDSSTVSDNTAFGDGEGGGIWTGGRPGTVILINSTVSGNSAGIGMGGGIMNTQDRVILINSTVSGNSARFGGGIANANSAVAFELTNSTVTGNIANNGSALRLNVGRVLPRNSIIDGTCSLVGGTVTSLGYNLDSGGSCGLNDPSDRHTSPKLGLLQNNGGPTETHALLPGSPAIDAVPLDFCTGIATDQRGVRRPQGLACDIGAYEVGTLTVGGSNQPPLANAGPDQTVEATGPSGASVTLDGSGSSDPNGDVLTYNWIGTFGAVSGVSPTITLPVGTHALVLVVNDAQATATDTVNITVQDTTPPNTIIISAKEQNGTAVVSGGSTRSKFIRFNFGGTDAVGVSRFQCKLDGAAFATCSNPVGYSALAIGSHIFRVRALDAAGNVDPSPASFAWTVVNPAQVIQDLITTIGNMGLPGGPANGLTAPLSQASNLLSDNNPNNDVAACGKLNAFVNQVNAKVQNGQLTSAQGSQLLQAANVIKSGLGC